MAGEMSDLFIHLNETIPYPGRLHLPGMFLNPKSRNLREEDGRKGADRCLGD